MGLVRETSMLAYHQLATLGLRQQEVYAIICRSSLPLTDREIARELGYFDPNKVRPRRNELVKAGLVEEVGKRICTVSGKLSLTWAATGLKQIIRVEGPSMTLEHYLPKDEWMDLNRLLKGRGYTYQGKGRWEKGT